MGTQGGGTRSGEARDAEHAGNSPPTLAGTKFPAGAGGTNCGWRTDLGRGERGGGTGAAGTGGGAGAAAGTTTTRGSGAEVPQVPEKAQDGVQGAARSHAGRQGTWLSSGNQVPAVSRHDVQNLG